MTTVALNEVTTFDQLSAQTRYTITFIIPISYAVFLILRDGIVILREGNRNLLFRPLSPKKDSLRTIFRIFFDRFLFLFLGTLYLAVAIGCLTFLTLALTFLTLALRSGKRDGSAIGDMGKQKSRLT